MLKYLTLLITFLFSQLLYARNDTLETSGDYLQIALPVTALISSYFLDDEETPENLKYYRFVESFSLGLATTYIVKLSAEKRRPNLGNEQSFPSAHTFAAVSGASFINKRFGPRYGIPAYLLAGVVGYSRIDSKAHFADDVLAGAAIAYLFNEFATSDSGIGINATKDSIGLNYSSSADFDELKKPPGNLLFYLFMGPTYIQDLMLHGEQNTDLSLDTLPREENYNYTSSIQVTYLLNQKNQFNLSFHPYEHLASGNLSNNFSFEGSSFAAGENMDFRWLQYNVDLNYNYSFYNNKYFEFLAGLGINGNYARLEAESNTSGNRYTTDRTGVIGNLSGQLHLKFNRSFKTVFWINWYNDSETKYFNGKIDFVYDLNSRWSLLARGTRFEQKLELVEFDKQGGEGIIFSNSAFNTIFLGVRYSL